MFGTCKSQVPILGQYSEVASCLGTQTPQHLKQVCEMIALQRNSWIK